VRRQTNSTWQAVPYNPSLYLRVSVVMQPRLGLSMSNNSWDGGWKGVTIWAVKDSPASETVAVSRGGTEFADGGCGGRFSMRVVGCTWGIEQVQRTIYSNSLSRYTSPSTSD
jgi:hypothetical protein